MGKFKCVVIDFETTGLSPGYGDRTIEVGAVVVENNTIVDRYQSLMNPGVRISSFIENYTGITNKMFSTAPAINFVMKQLSKFIAHHPLIAHNASFDSLFLGYEYHHRALADAEMTSYLWIEMVSDLKETHGLQQVPFELLHQFAKVPKKKVSDYLQKYGQKVPSQSQL